MIVDGNQRVDSLFIQQLINIYLKKINKYYVPVKIQVNGASSLYEKALASLLDNQKEVSICKYTCFYFAILYDCYWWKKRICM